MSAEGEVAAPPYSPQEIEAFRRNEGEFYTPRQDRWIATVDALRAEVAAKDELIGKLVAQKPPQRRGLDIRRPPLDVDGKREYGGGL